VKRVRRTRERASLSALVAVVAVAMVILASSRAPAFLPSVAEPLEPPSLRHWFGTDDLGRDLFAGVVEGGRLSLLVGFGVASFSLLLGTGVGMVAGLSGGVVDELLMRVIELFQILPRFFLALAVLMLWGSDWLHLVLVLGLTSWADLARLARTETLVLRGQSFIDSAQSAGASMGTILWRHVLPNVVRPVLTAASFVASGAMLAEAGLSFLGLSSTERVSWGYLLHNAQPFLREAWWMALFPGIAITVTVFFFTWMALSDREEFLRVIR
jgi:peptide/nickel transport system permease protein